MTRTERNRQYYQRNKERLKAANRERYAENSEEIKAKERDRYHDNREKIQDRRSSEEFLEGNRSRERDRYAQGDTKLFATRARSYAKNAERTGDKGYARRAVFNAVRAGMIVQGTCSGSDCEGRLEAHHEDYTKPLDVEWLCKKHHDEHHAA